MTPRNSRCTYVESTECVCLFFTSQTVISIRRHPAHPVSVPILLPQEIQLIITTVGRRPKNGQFGVETRCFPLSTAQAKYF